MLAYQKELQTLSFELCQVEEEERRHIAADLHDSIGQTLSLSMIKLEGLQESLSDYPQTEEVEEIKALIEKTLHNSRTLTFELCPPILYELGFEAAVEQLIEIIKNQYGIHIDLKVENKPISLSEDLRYFLFRATRELLINVVKHANVSASSLIIKKEKNTIHVEVLDEGTGFDSSRVKIINQRNAPFGLFSIRERLKRIGGRLVVESAAGKGSRVILIVPLGNGAENEKDGSI